MKTLMHAKILIEPDTYSKFLLLAKDRGMKIQAYLGILIEREIASNGYLPPYRKTEKNADGVPADPSDANQKKTHPTSEIARPAGFSLPLLRHSEAPAIPESPYGGAPCDVSFFDESKEAK